MKRIFGSILVGALIVIFAVLAISTLKERSIQESGSNTLTPTLILNQIKVIKEQEGNGDELYLTLSTRVAKQPTEYIRIPKKPDHWLSRQMNLIKDVTLWSEPLSDGQSVTLIIELNEEDALPLQPDDLLGLMRVQLKNDQGVLKFVWDAPNQTAVAKRKGEVAHIRSPALGSEEKFEFENDGAHYEVYLSLRK